MLDYEVLLAYKKPTDSSLLFLDGVCRAIMHLAEVLNECCPESDELRIAGEKLRECRMWANAAIVLHQKL